MNWGAAPAPEVREGWLRSQGELKKSSPQRNNISRLEMANAPAAPAPFASHTMDVGGAVAPAEGEEQSDEAI